MMELSVACPLCSQPGFPDVNSLWLTLIRVTTRQLSCPVCSEVLCGLDKLTIHLVSHSLHDHLLQACVASNFPSPATTFTKSNTLLNAVSASPQEMVHVTNNENASFVLINMASGEGVSVVDRNQDHAADFIKENRSDNEKSVLASSSQDAKFPALLNCKTEKPSAPNLISLSTHQNTPSNERENLKFITQHRHLENEHSLGRVLSQAKQEQMSSSSEGIATWHGNTSEKELQIPRNCNESGASEFSHGFAVNSKSESVEEKNETVVVCDNMENFSLETPDRTVRCGLCDLTLKDGHIAMLHQQFVHNLRPQDGAKNGMALEPDDINPSKPCKSKRVTTASQIRDGAGPLHRFPCHICNKVFRMRGSLMVHVRVAHTSIGTVSLASRLGGSTVGAKPSVSGDVGKLPLQNLTIREIEAPLASDMIKSGHFENKNVNQKIFDPTSSLFTMSSAAHKPVKEMCTVSNQLSGCDVGSSKGPVSPPVSPTPSPTAQESTGPTFLCYMCNKTFSKETLLAQHIKTHDSKQWECDVCFKSFTTKYFLKKHKRLHTGEMPYTCGICNKSFTFQQSYHKHLLYHSDEKPHSCNECGRAFKELSTLHNHQRIHTGEKPWACETCGKCFRQRVSYLVHRRIHTGAMPYQCTVCLKSFRYKVSQRTHKCIAVPSSEAATQPLDPLQQLLLSTSNEEHSQRLGAELSPTSPTLFIEPQTHLENQPGIKQGDIPPCVMDVPHTEEQISNDSLVIPKALQLEHQTSHMQSSDVHLPSSLSQIINFEDFPSLHPPDNGTVPEGTLHCGNGACSVFNFNSTPQEPLESKNVSNASVTLSQPSPPTSSSDFNVDILQDILSMVMSPSSGSTPSPSSQMRHLSLSGQSEDDIESGWDLRQLLEEP